MSTRSAPLDAYGAPMVCECGVNDWQQVIALPEPNPVKRVRWECRDCGRIYTADGKLLGHDGRSVS